MITILLQKILEQVKALKTNIENMPSGTSQDYSLEEKKIGKWIDGSDLYQKSYKYENIGGSTSNKSFYPDLTGMSNIMLYDAYTMAGDGGLNIANCYYNSNNYAFAMWIENRTFTYKYCWGSASTTPAATIFVTIRYTKSTT